MGYFIPNPPTTGTLQAVIHISEGNPSYLANKSDYYSYYDTASDADVNLERGRVPYSVMFHGFNSTPQDRMNPANTSRIVAYNWRILDTDGITVLDAYDSFNVPYVFETAGTYTAELTVTDALGATHTTTKTVEAIARSGVTYYFDAVNGDDRFDGLTMATAKRTATFAFQMTNPFVINDGMEDELSLDDISSASATSTFRNYLVGNDVAAFKKYRSSTSRVANMQKQPNGHPEPEYDVTTYTLNDRAVTILQDGDEIAFKRGQTFKLISAAPTIDSYTAVDGFITYEYEKLLPYSLAIFDGGVKGIHFTAYGTGADPIIKDESVLGGASLVLWGGIFHPAISDIEFNLESDRYNPLRLRTARGCRSQLISARTNTTNITLNRVTVKHMEQGVIAQGSSEIASKPIGLFMKDCNFYDSNITQLFTDSAYRDLGIEGCSFDYSANHLAYTSSSDGAVYNNNFSRPAYGRTGYRLAGNTYDDPDKWVSIKHNIINGWIDPRDFDLDGDEFSGGGADYNYSLINISPNINKYLEETKGLINIEFSDNTATGFDGAANFASVQGLIVKDNIFTTYSSQGTFDLASSFGQRPVDGLHFTDNEINIYSNYEGGGGYGYNTINLNMYNYQVNTDLAEHRDVRITGNVVTICNTQTRMIGLHAIAGGTLDAAEIAIPSFLTVDGNTVNLSNGANALIGLNDDRVGRMGINDTGASHAPYREFNGIGDFTTRFYNTTSSTLYTSIVSAMTVNVITFPIATNTTLPNATVGVAYSHTLTYAGAAPTEYKLLNGTLTGLGLSFNLSTGEISGTPTGAGIITRLKFALHNASGATATPLMNLTVLA